MVNTIIHRVKSRHSKPKVSGSRYSTADSLPNLAANIVPQLLPQYDVRFVFTAKNAIILPPADTTRAVWADCLMATLNAHLQAPSDDDQQERTDLKKSVYCVAMI